MTLTKAQRRFLRWLGTYCAPGGTTINTGGRCQVARALAHRGLITWDGDFVALTDAGRDALDECRGGKP